LGPYGNPLSAPSINHLHLILLKTNVKTLLHQQITQKYKRLVCVVFLITLLKSLKESLPLIKAKIDAPKAPTPDASVGVAIPIKILPRTARINNAGGIIDLNTLKIIFNVTGFAFLVLEQLLVLDMHK